VTGIALLPALRQSIVWRLHLDTVSAVAGLGVGAVWALLVNVETVLPMPVEALTWTSLAIWLMGGLVVLPSAQELFFRGYLLTRAGTAPAPKAAAVVVGALLFGALQSDWFVGSLAGLAFAGLVLRSGRVTDAIVAHVMAKAVLTSFALTSLGS
jgi:membrane protease YdiL (CAAX protease family)